MDVSLIALLEDSEQGVDVSAFSALLKKHEQDCTRIALLFSWTTIQKLNSSLWSRSNHKQSRNIPWFQHSRTAVTMRPLALLEDSVRFGKQDKVEEYLLLLCSLHECLCSFLLCLKVICSSIEICTLLKKLDMELHFSLVLLCSTWNVVGTDECLRSPPFKRKARTNHVSASSPHYL